MKILQVNCVYKKGSTGKITYDLHCGLLATKHESVVCYGRGKKLTDPFVYKTCSEWYSKCNNLLSRITGMMYGGCFFSTINLFSIIRREKPDIVHLQCINGYFVNIYRLINWLKKKHIKTVLTLHAEFMFTANCGHSLDCNKWMTGCGGCPRKSETKSLFFDGTSISWKRMKNAFSGFDSIIVASVSPWLMNRAVNSPILQDKTHVVVYNGVNDTVFHEYDTEELRRRLGCADKKIVFHVTPFFSTERNHFKGGWFICELAKKMPDYQFIVAGNSASNCSLPENVSLLGVIVDPVILANYYSLADVTVIASKKETFSMVVAESLCCGTPVAGFKAGGPEQIALPQFSRFAEYGDLQKLIECVMDCISIKGCPDIQNLAIKRYSNDRMVSDYISVYSKLYGSEVENS